ncbi:MAG: UDP-N-acetylmuramoyl-L-alanine--D-glutamate ligase, partial [Clostridia bacterium]|nr:UDP-N-acetylmuramoyl-L-alanine--D-glutamate ligase [Clostridia bacterium]
LISYIRYLIKDKSVCMLGFGREGKSTLNTFLKAGGYKSITICDLNEVSCTDAITVTGKDYQKNLDQYDIIMKSPGIVLEENSLTDFSRLYSQAQVFLSVYRDRTIGITGTKGKSTTTCLIYHVLKECGKGAVLLGNIGIPPFEGDVSDGDTVVLEMSSHQLEYTTVSPHTGVFLNIFPEHLDHYGTFEKYFDAKKHIYRYQKEGDRLICGEDVIPCEMCLSDITVFGQKGDVIIKPASFIVNGEEITLDATCPLLGAHNVNNIAVAYLATKPYGITREQFLSALATFKTLPHRLERVGEKDGITFYDDSISTCSETTIQALQSINNVGTLLVGGMDRGIDYSPLISFLSDFDIKNVIFMYDTGKRILDEFKGIEHKFTAHYTPTLDEAVKIAKAVTPKGSVCLLSPAAASYGFFKNFEERGDKFKEYSLK